MIDPITKYILEREALSTAIKRIGKCDWKCDRMLKMHEKRAAILLAGLVSGPGAVGGMLLYQMYSKSGLLNNFCLMRCAVTWSKNMVSRNRSDKEKYNKYIKILKYFENSVKENEERVLSRLKKYKQKGNEKAYTFMKKAYDDIKRM